MAASLATLEDTGSVSDSSSVSESEIPYSTRILLITVEKLKKAKPAGADFNLYCFALEAEASRGRLGQSCPRRRGP